MFILSRRSSAYGDSRPQLIKAETISDACKKVLQARDSDSIKDVDSVSVPVRIGPRAPLNR
jgi:hypothetical protein